MEVKSYIFPFLKTILKRISFFKHVNVLSVSDSCNQVD
jgi:hypothetical protein